MWMRIGQYRDHLHSSHHYEVSGSTTLMGSTQIVNSLDVSGTSLLRGNTDVSGTWMYQERYQC